MTIQQGLQRIVESVILYFTEDFPFRKRNKVTPSLLAMNMNWFTNCSWREQLVAFKQLELYSAKNI